MPTTHALRALRRLGLAHRIGEYEHRKKGAEHAAGALAWPLEEMFKTLVVALSDGSFVLCLMPGNEELSLKALARQAGVKSARLASREEAERQTGYRVGGISPFGTRRRMPVWAHRTFLEAREIGINGGRRGLIVFVDPRALAVALDIRVAELAS